MPKKKRVTKKRAARKSPSNSKLPRELWKMSDEQIRDTVQQLSRLSLAELRRRQDLNVAAQQKAYRDMPVGELRERALGNTQANELLLQSAVALREFGEPVDLSFARLREIYGGGGTPGLRSDSPQRTASDKPTFYVHLTKLVTKDYGDHLDTTWGVSWSDNEEGVHPMQGIEIPAKQPYGSKEVAEELLRQKLDIGASQNELRIIRGKDLVRKQDVNPHGLS